MKHAHFFIVAGFVMLMTLILSGGNGHGARMKTRKLDYAVAWQTYLNKDTRLEPAKRYPYESCFRKASKKYNLPLTLLLAFARGESDFNPRAGSKASCYGIMQIQWPGTAGDLGFNSKKELYDPCRNILAGARYIKMMLERYDGNLHLAVAAYNYGPGRISRGAGAYGIPSGANWYSGYIYHHLQQVLKGATPGRGTPVMVASLSTAVNYKENDSRVLHKTSRKYMTLGRREGPAGAGSDAGTGAMRKKEKYKPGNKVPVILFHDPFMARNFFNYFEEKSPEVRLDWFRTSLGETYIVLLFATEKEKTSSVARMKSLGYSLDLNNVFQ